MIFLQSHPHLALQKFIGQYISLSFNTAVLPSLRQTFLPYDIPAISFFFGPVAIEHSTKNLPGTISAASSKSATSHYAGLITTPFSFYFNPNQDLKALIIVFRASGFSAFFGKDIAELTDQVPDFSLVAGASATELFLEQLAEAKDFTTQVKICDTFFLKRISHRQNSAEQIKEACRILIVADGLVNIKDLAYHTNMSLKTLDRHFTERVGIPPKLFARLKRFHHALSLMNDKKPLPWYPSVQPHLACKFKSI